MTINISTFKIYYPIEIVEYIVFVVFRLRIKGNYALKITKNKQYYLYVNLVCINIIYI